VLRIVASDVDTYQRLIEDLLERNIGIERYYSYIVTKPVKRFSGYPLEEMVNLDGGNSLSS
jgi:Lrp/AsnC family transcriptional regulator of ectoine degradation